MDSDPTLALVALQLAVGRNPADVGTDTTDVLAEAREFYAFLTNPNASET